MVLQLDQADRRFAPFSLANSRAGVYHPRTPHADLRVGADHITAPDAPVGSPRILRTAAYFDPRRFNRKRTITHGASRL